MKKEKSNVSEKEVNKFPRKAVWAIGGILAAAIIIVSVLFIVNRNYNQNEQTNDASANSAQQESSAQPEESMTELTIDSVEEQGAFVVVATSYGTVKYPFAFADLIQITPVTNEESAVLAFTVQIDETERKLFDLVFNGQEEIIVGTVQVSGEQEPVAVTAKLYTPDDDLDESALITFYAAQESFNDVVGSLSENENFAPAE